MSTLLTVLVVHSLLLVALLLGHGRRADRANSLLAVLVAAVALLLVEAWLGWSGLRLDNLAQRLTISRHHLSQLLNQHLATTFRDYVNDRRVAEARRLLLDASWDGNVLAVGMAAGFGSSASFYRAFRRHVGCTPKELVARHRQAQPPVYTDEARYGEPSCLR